MRKLIFSGATLLFLVVACNVEVKTADVWNCYGPEEVDSTKAVGIGELEKTMASEKEGKQVTFRAQIKEVCSKAGCWISVTKSDGTPMRVVFKDHFTIPVKTKLGTEAFISGLVYWDSIPVELEQHYAEDAGKSADEIAKIKSKFELNFEAEGICFKTKK